MIIGAPHAVAECGVSSFSGASRQHHPLRLISGASRQHHPLRLITPCAEGLLQRRKAKHLSLVRASPPLQQERGPISSEASPQSVQSQLELLEKITSGKEKDGDGNTIGEQLAKKVVVDPNAEVAIPLGKQNPLDYDDLTVSQKRNIRRQKYLDQVSKRNDAPFFTAIALFVILPPVVILGVAVATGYVELLP